MITGGIKFFEVSANLTVNGAVASATSGNDTAPYLLGLNKDVQWRSVGSMDGVTETIVIQFPVPTFINRVFLINHNFKIYTVKYHSAGMFIDFTNVKSITGSSNQISENNYHLDTSYYEFNGVTTDQIQIAVSSTQIANQDKYMNQVTATTELGTLVGYPMITGIDVNRSLRANQTISGKFSVEKSIETIGFNLQLKKYASSAAYAPDMDLLISLHDREKVFNAWLCGGRQGTGYFPVTLRGFRLRDVLQMQLTKPLQLSYDSNLYGTNLNGTFYMYEHI